jgi:hypothetical protein
MADLRIGPFLEENVLDGRLTVIDPGGSARRRFFSAPRQDLSQIGFSGPLDAMQGSWKARQSRVPDETIRSAMF